MSTVRWNVLGQHPNSESIEARTQVATTNCVTMTLERALDPCVDDGNRFVGNETDRGIVQATSVNESSSKLGDGEAERLSLASMVAGMSVMGCGPVCQGALAALEDMCTVCAEWRRTVDPDEEDEVAYAGCLVGNLFLAFCFGMFDSDFHFLFHS